MESSNLRDPDTVDEEYQIQMALELSAREDPEAVQIEAVKQISLGSFPPDNTPAEVTIYKYWYAGKETVHQLYGTHVAVLAGDFMFAQSSWYLANLENLEVIKLISQTFFEGKWRCKGVQATPILVLANSASLSHEIHM